MTDSRSIHLTTKQLYSNKDVKTKTNKQKNQKENLPGQNVD